MWGTLLAIYVLATGVQGLQLVSGASWLSDMFNGVALIIAVALSIQRSPSALGQRIKGRLRPRFGAAGGPEQPGSGADASLEERLPHRRRAPKRAPDPTEVTGRRSKPRAMRDRTPSFGRIVTRNSHQKERHMTHHSRLDRRTGTPAARVAGSPRSSARSRSRSRSRPAARPAPPARPVPPARGVDRDECRRSSGSGSISAAAAALHAVQGAADARSTSRLRSSLRRPPARRSSMLGTNNPSNVLIQQGMQKLADDGALELLAGELRPGQPGNVHAAITTALAKHPQYLSRPGIPLTARSSRWPRARARSGSSTRSIRSPSTPPVIGQVDAYAQDALMGKIIADYFIVTTPAARATR